VEGEIEMFSNGFQRSKREISDEDWNYRAVVFAGDEA
jgi:hypothetical protein